MLSGFHGHYIACRCRSAVIYIVNKCKLAFYRSDYRAYQGPCLARPAHAFPVSPCPFIPRAASP